MSTEQVAPQEEGIKVFAGNLAFSTKDADLTELFSQHGKVLNAQVINRGTRSLGYGFITFADQVEAEKAVSALDKSDVGGRAINVELAKPASTTPRAPREKKPRAPAAAAAVEANGDEVPAENGEAVPKKKKARKPKSRKPKAEGDAAATDAPVADLADKLASTNIDESGAPKATRTRKPRAPRPEGAAPVRRGPPTGEPSKTLIFVANLPFSVDDAKLKEIFAAYKTVSARVVTKKVGPSAGRSKGFGFVEFESEEEQTKAIAEVQGKSVDDRELQLKIAIGSGEKPAEDVAAEADVVA